MHKIQPKGVNAGARTFFHGVPYEYSNYRTEILGSKKSAWFGIGLNLISPTYDVSGPDALEFFNSVCVNDFRKLKEGSIRHAVMCNEKGQILTDGVVMSLPNGVYRTYWLEPRFLLQQHLSRRYLAFIKKEYAKEGTCVTILWGTPGKRQFEMKAIIAKCPYNAEFGRNETIDVNEAPYA